ncbi:MAG: hypothetical protein AB1510_11545 [Bacillota bacterium]
MKEEDRILEKLRKIEALFAGATTPGERKAAEAAKERIREKLKNIQRAEEKTEWKFSLNNPWSRKLLIALLRRYDVVPYRRYGQRRTTVMARMPRTFAEQIFLPEFESLNEILLGHLDQLAEQIIQKGIFKNTSDAEEK